MANRRPPLFELLQKESEARQKGDAQEGRPGVLSGGQTMSTSAPVKPNGQAEGAVESKPAAATQNGSATSTIDDLSERADKAERSTATAPAAPPKPPVRQAKPKAAPKPKPKHAEAKPQPDKGGGAADWSAMHPKRTVSFPMLWVYGAIVIGFAAVVSVWALAYSMGVHSEEAKFEEYLRQSDQSTLIRDPIAGGAATTASQPGGERLAGQDTGGAPRVEPAPTTPDRDEPAPPPVEQQQQAAIPAIDVFEDVRQTGNNYLKLASGMTRERAQGLAEHLTANGVHAMALDEIRQGFGLYTAFPVPSNQYSRLAPERRDLQARVIALLGEVPSDLGGPFVPRNPIWIRFDG